MPGREGSKFSAATRPAPGKNANGKGWYLGAFPYDKSVGRAG